MDSSDSNELCLLFGSSRPRNALARLSSLGRIAIGEEVDIYWSGDCLDSRDGLVSRRGCSQPRDGDVTVHSAFSVFAAIASTACAVAEGSGKIFGHSWGTEHPAARYVKMLTVCAILKSTITLHLFSHLAVG